MTFFVCQTFCKIITNQNALILKQDSSKKIQYWWRYGCFSKPRQATPHRDSSQCNPKTPQHGYLQDSLVMLHSTTWLALCLERGLGSKVPTQQELQHFGWDIQSRSQAKTLHDLGTTWAQLTACLGITLWEQHLMTSNHLLKPLPTLGCHPRLMPPPVGPPEGGWLS